jgi:hypothetical protein
MKKLFQNFENFELAILFNKMGASTPGSTDYFRSSYKKIAGTSHKVLYTVKQEIMLGR